VLGREPRLTLRLLLIALPLSLTAAWLIGFVLLPGPSPWLLAVLAAIVMSVDLAPGASFVRDRRIPERLRQVLNAESGLNDGIVAPVFLFCLAAATAAGGEAQADAAIDAVPSPHRPPLRKVGPRRRGRPVSALRLSLRSGPGGTRLCAALPTTGSSRSTG
jgi:sodium/hydrogen antiporter